MTVTSIFTNPETGQPYKVGDKLATKEEAIAFAKAVGWESFLYTRNIFLLEDKDGNGVTSTDIDEGACLPYTITGILPHHIAKQTTPNPPLTFEEAMNKKCWAYDPTRPYLQSRYMSSGRIEDVLEYHSLLSMQENGLCFYAHDPSVVPPTERDGE